MGVGRPKRETKKNVFEYGFHPNTWPLAEIEVKIRKNQEQKAFSICVNTITFDNIMRPVKVPTKKGRKEKKRRIFFISLITSIQTE